MKLLPDHIQAFLSVVQTGTVHAAGKKIGLTQTAVTRRIANLELELGASLFLRSRRGMTLTHAGSALLSYCRQVIDLEGEVLAKISGENSQEAKKLAIEGPSSVLRSRVIPSLKKVMQKYPNLAIEFRLSDVDSGVNSLKRGRADIVLLPQKTVVHEFESKVLKPERYILVGPKSWQGRELADIVKNERIIDFDPNDEMTFHVLKSINLLAKARKDRHFANNTDALTSMIELGLGYSVLSAEFVAPFVEGGRIVAIGGRAFYNFEIALAWYHRRHLPPYFRDVLKAIR